MFPRLFRLVLAVTSSAIIIPYTLAIWAEVLYGKPKRSLESVLKSLHPSRVFAFTKSFVLSMRSYRYTGLYLKWTMHYKSLSPSIAIKDVEYGSNQNTLDIYKPPTKGNKQTVVVFLYGGTWSSGNKNMYSLLCCTLASRLQALVLCPNYSIYPKGYVDDMVQDVSDVITWAREHVSFYGGDPEKVVLMGHSAGAHLAALTTIELAAKHLSGLPGMLQQKLLTPQTLTGAPLKIDYLEPSTSFLDTYFTNRCSDENLAQAIDEVKGLEAEERREEDRSEEVKREGEKEREVKEEGVEMEEEGVEVVKGGEISESTTVGTSDKTAESFVMVASPRQELNSEGSTYHALEAIKLVIGLAGVYDIREQYKLQLSNATEHTSPMTRAMYDVEHFDDFSPTFALKHISASFRLPPFLLLHGDSDLSVSLQNSISFASALSDRQADGARLGVLKGCDHYEVCVDLMQEQMLWHHCILGQIFKAFRENGL